MDVDKFRVSTDDGVGVCLHARIPENPNWGAIFVHGATYGGRAVFDPEGIPEYSWLRWAADNDVAAFAVDIRGYGDSERPPGMLPPTEVASPPVRASTAATDVAAAIGHIKRRHPFPIHLVGTSWGTMIVGTLLSQPDPPAIESATLYAPVFTPDPAIIEGLITAPMTTARTLTKPEVRTRWDDQIPHSPAAEFRGGTIGSDPVFESFWKTLTASGQGIEERGARKIVAPNGTLVDLRDASRGNPPYDPASIEVPTLVIRGASDPTSTREDATGLYDALSVPHDRATYVEISGGTHFTHLERRRKTLYQSVKAFQSRHSGGSV